MLFLRETVHIAQTKYIFLFSPLRAGRLSASVDIFPLDVHVHNKSPCPLPITREQGDKTIMPFYFLLLWQILPVTE